MCDRRITGRLLNTFFKWVTLRCYVFINRLWIFLLTCSERVEAPWTYKQITRVLPFSSVKRVAGCISSRLIHTDSNFALSRGINRISCAPTSASCIPPRGCAMFLRSAKDKGQSCGTQVDVGSTYGKLTNILYKKTHFIPKPMNLLWSNKLAHDHNHLTYSYIFISVRCPNALLKICSKMLLLGAVNVCTLFLCIKGLFLQTVHLRCSLSLSVAFLVTWSSALLIYYCSLGLIVCLPQLFVYFQVYGIPRLRVVDASIMPNIVSGKQLKEFFAFSFFQIF